MSRRPTTTPSNRIERRAERQAKQPGGAPPPRRQRPTRSSTAGGPKPISWQPFAIVLGIAAIIIIIVYAVVAQTTATNKPPPWQTAALDSDPRLPGTYYAAHPGPDGVAGNSDDRLHFGNGVVHPICTQEQIDSGFIFDPLCYQSNPPTSGPHASSPMQFGVLENPAPKENLIHNMEHGGVVVWYNTTDQDVIDDLKSIVREQYNDRRRLVVLSSYSGMEPETIALTSWTRLDKFPASDFQEKRVTDFIEEHQRRFNPEGL